MFCVVNFFQGHGLFEFAKDPGARFRDYIVQLVAEASETLPIPETDDTLLDMSGAELLIQDGESATIAVTGAITDVGTAENSYEITWDGAKAENYVLTEELGTLEVTENEAKIVFTAPSASKVYDGEALTAGEIAVTGLPSGVTYTAAAGGSQTDAGSSENAVASYAILDASSNDVTGCFTNITTESGTLTVEPAGLTVITGSATKAYDGTALTQAEDAEITGLQGSDAVTFTVTGTITDETVIIDAGDEDVELVLDNVTIRNVCASLPI